jgi:ElaB/YqjD/DUF883 family membrane-anchored ribosome-binding protein
MEDEEVIRRQMEETRTSLTEKLETLENKVAETVEEATSAVTETVATVKDSIQDTVTTVKDTVEGTVTSVKDTLQEGVNTVKSMFDLPHLVEQHPWPVIGASIALGYCLERYFGKTDSVAEKMSEAAVPVPKPPAPAAAAKHMRGHHSPNGGREKPTARKSSLLASLAPEIDQLKGLALGALFGTAREMIVQTVPSELGGQLKNIVDNITKKLGGKPIAGPLFQAQSASEREHAPQSLGERDRGGWQADH